jgi:hypothetical protein
MSSASQSSPTTLNRADYLKRELTEFATAGPLKEEYERQRQLFFELTAPSDEHEAESVLDWFLFEWLDDRGEGVIEHFLTAREDLSAGDQEALLDWEDSVNSAFEIRAVSKNSMKLKDLESEETFDVVTSQPLEGTPFKRGQYIIARLLPLGDQFIFSGLQFVMPDRQSAEAWLEMRQAFDEMDSPEAIENAQREQCRAFCDLFGCEELTLSSGELKPTLQRFQSYLLTERRDPESGLTAAEVFREEFGRELQVPEMPPLPDPLASAGEVTILCDDFDGIVLLPDYNRFRRVFESRNPEKEVGEWRELVWKYIKDPDIPIVAFERVAEQIPERVESVLRLVLDDREFTIEHLYAVLLHYKEPVEGVDLEADERLWDLFDGNGGNGPEKAGAAAKPKTDGGPRQASSTRKPAAAKSSTKAKATTKKSSKKPSPKSSKKAASKSAKKAASRKGTSAKKRAPAKKR